MTKHSDTNQPLTRDEAEALRRKFMNGHTTPEEEQALRQWAAQAAPDGDWALRLMLLSPLPAEDEADDLLAADYTAEYDSLVRQRRRRVFRLRLSPRTDPKEKRPVSKKIPQ